MPHHCPSRGYERRCKYTTRLYWRKGSFFGNDIASNSWTLFSFYYLYFIKKTQLFFLIKGHSYVFNTIANIHFYLYSASHPTSLEKLSESPLTDISTKRSSLIHSTSTLWSPRSTPSPTATTSLLLTRSLLASPSQLLSNRRLLTPETSENFERWSWRASLSKLYHELSIRDWISCSNGRGSASEMKI